MKSMQQSSENMAARFHVKRNLRKCHTFQGCTVDVARPAREIFSCEYRLTISYGEEIHNYVQLNL